MIKTPPSETKADTWPPEVLKKIKAACQTVGINVGELERLYESGRSPIAATWRDWNQAGGVIPMLAALVKGYDLAAKAYNEGVPPAKARAGRGVGPAADVVRGFENARGLSVARIGLALGGEGIEKALAFLLAMGRTGHHLEVTPWNMLRNEETGETVEI
jgi:hypothetical protein